MEFRFHKQLYSDGLSPNKISSAKRKIMHGAKTLNMFLITLPIGGEGILEIYWYPELTQKIYQDMDVTVTVVGLAKSREDAFSLVERIVKDIGVYNGEISVIDYFGENS